MCLQFFLHSHRTALHIVGSDPHFTMRKPRLREIKTSRQVPSMVKGRTRPPGVCSSPVAAAAWALAQPYHPDAHRLCSPPLLSPSAGPAPSEEAGTKARFRLSDAAEEGAWRAEVVDQQDNTLSLQLSTPASAPIGLYRLNLEASTGYEGSSFLLGHFTLLFNAWCPGKPGSSRRQGGEMGRARTPPNPGPTEGGEMGPGGGLGSEAPFRKGLRGRCPGPCLGFCPALFPGALLYIASDWSCHCGSAC